jgi:hypothetical protein
MQSISRSRHAPPGVRGENAGAMHGELFDSTLPFGEPELMHASAYLRYLAETQRGEGTLSGEAASRAGLPSLSPSLRGDLVRIDEDSRGSSDPLEVVAACVRHVARLTIHLQCSDRAVPLTVFAQERLVHCPMDLAVLVERHLPTVRVLSVGPALLQPPGDGGTDPSSIGADRLHHPLAPLLWELAMRGPRRELLPEIAGPAVYRVAPSLQIGRLPAGGSLRAVTERLRRQPASLGEVSHWPAMDRERASRLLNALYLQAGLIVSRAHPAAVRESWFGGH